MADTNESVVDSGSIDELVKRYDGSAGALLGILEQAQERDRFKHLNEGTLRLIADKTGTPLSQLYSVVTFYSFFNLKPQGLHSITVCRGTACHTRGSRVLLEEAVRKLGATDYHEEEESSFTTGDKQFTVRTVACFGQCALAPVVAIDGVIHSRITAGKLIGIIEKIAKKGSL